MAVGPPRPVPCAGCGVILQRRTHYNSAKARCKSCHNKHSNKRWMGQIKSMREQARRYRIITHVLGWEETQWEEMIQEMKRCPMTFRKRPETTMARRDFYKEGLRAQ